MTGLFVVDGEIKMVEGCLSGNEISVRTLVEHFQGAVFGLCFRMLGHREDAEDVSQDVFVRVFKSLHRWDRVRPLKPWILTIAANRCRTALEKRSRRPACSEFPPDATADTRNVKATDVGEELQLALDGLREDYRACFVLFYQQELSCAEVGEVLKCPVGTVKTWLHRARQQLADHLQRRGVSPEDANELHRI
jgi:RNA polymerase sigma-70 factor, ECF subfamily